MCSPVSRSCSSSVVSLQSSVDSELFASIYGNLSCHVILYRCCPPNSSSVSHTRFLLMRSIPHQPSLSNFFVPFTLSNRFDQYFFCRGFFWLTLVKGSYVCVPVLITSAVIEIVKLANINSIQVGQGTVKAKTNCC